MKIRRATALDDLKAIQALDDQFFTECCPPGKGIVWWAAKDSRGELSGYAGARIIGQEIYLERAGVCKWARGNGLQKRLIRTRLRYGRAMGCTHAITYTINNPASANSLIACGFRSYIPAYPWVDGEDCNYWRLEL